jgi:hypothetical protein
MNRTTLIHTLKQATPLLAAAVTGALVTLAILHRDDIIHALRDRMKPR